jgi:hypothetical protein
MKTLSPALRMIGVAFTSGIFCNHNKALIENILTSVIQESSGCTISSCTAGKGRCTKGSSPGPITSLKITIKVPDVVPDTLKIRGVTNRIQMEKTAKRCINEAAVSGELARQLSSLGFMPRTMTIDPGVAVIKKLSFKDPAHPVALCPGGCTVPQNQDCECEAVRRLRAHLQMRQMSLEKAASEMGTTNQRLSERRKGLYIPRGEGELTQYDGTIIAWCEGRDNDGDNDNLIRESDKLVIDEETTAHVQKMSPPGSSTIFAKKQNKCRGVPLQWFNRVVSNKVFQPEGVLPLAVVLNSTGMAQLSDGDSAHSTRCCAEAGEYLNAKKRCKACDDESAIWKKLHPHHDLASELNKAEKTIAQMKKAFRLLREKKCRKEKAIKKLKVIGRVHSQEKKRMLNTKPDADGNRLIIVEGGKSNEPLVAAVARAVTSGWLTEDMFLYRFTFCQLDALRHHVKGGMRGMKWGEKYRDVVEFFQALRMCGEKVMNIMRGCDSYKGNRPNLFLPSKTSMKAYTPAIQVKPGLAPRKWQ